MGKKIGKLFKIISKNLIKNQTNVGWVPADLSLTSLGFIADPEPFGSFGDIRLTPIADTKVFFSPSEINGRDLEFYLTHIVNPDGSLWHCDPRYALERAVSKLTLFPLMFCEVTLA